MTFSLRFRAAVVSIALLATSITSLFSSWVMMALDSMP